MSKGEPGGTDTCIPLPQLKDDVNSVLGTLAIPCWLHTELSGLSTKQFALLHFVAVRACGQQSFFVRYDLVINHPLMFYLS